MLQMQANQHLLLQPWILAERIGSIVLSGYILDTTPDVSITYDIACSGTVHDIIVIDYDIIYNIIVNIIL